MSVSTATPVYGQGVMLLGAPEAVVERDAFRGGEVLGRDAATTLACVVGRQRLEDRAAAEKLVAVADWADLTTALSDCDVPLVWVDPENLGGRVRGSVQWLPRWS